MSSYWIHQVLCIVLYIPSKLSGTPYKWVALPEVPLNYVHVA